MDIHLKSLKALAGEGVTLTENPKSIKKRDKQFFLQMVEILSNLDERTNILMEMGIDLIRYEDPHFQLIENLIIKHYGPLKGGIILWWCGERKLLDSKVYNLIDEDGKGTMVSNVTQLYNFLNKMK